MNRNFFSYHVVFHALLFKAKEMKMQLQFSEFSKTSDSKKCRRFRKL